jgi:hypothetical protein
VLRAVCAGPEHVGWGLGGLDRQLARGELLGEILAQRHPTVLWAKEWDRYVVVGTPDGIGEDFVYEFKSTRMSYGGLRRYVLPITRAQENIYAWLFKRQRWVVEIFSCEDLKLYRWEGEAGYVEEGGPFRHAASLTEGRVEEPMAIGPFPAQRA